MTDERTMNIDQFCQHYNLKKSTVYRWTSQGKIPHLKTGRGLRFYCSVVDEFFKKTPQTRERLAPSHKPMISTQQCSLKTEKKKGSGMSLESAKEDLWQR